jgi:hypothetical protein
MVTCPPQVKPGQKIRFQLPVQLSSDQLAAIKVSYDKDGWMRCLGQDLKFHWVYNTSNITNVNNNQVTKFNVNEVAFVREFKLNDSKKIVGVNFQPATEYAIETQVTGTSVNYQELSSIAQLPFQQKTDWLKNQFNMIRTSWEEGHMKIKVILIIYIFTFFYFMFFFIYILFISILKLSPPRLNICNYFPPFFFFFKKNIN